MYRFHGGSSKNVNTIAIQLWSTDSEIVFHEGTQTQCADIDENLSSYWGLLAMKVCSGRPGVVQKRVTMKDGGLYVTRSL